MLRRLVTSLLLLNILACAPSHEVDSVTRISVEARLLWPDDSNQPQYATIGSGIAFSEKHSALLVLSDDVLRKKNKYLYPLVQFTLPLRDEAKELLRIQSKTRFDFEDIAFDSDGFLWLSDEAHPLAVRYSFPELKKQETLKPGKQLPKRYRRIQEGRGFEALGFANGKVFLMPQSPLRRKKAELEPSIRLLSYGTEDGEVKEYCYQPEFTDADTKIGALSAVDQSTLFVLEHGSRGNGESFSHVFRVTLEQAESDCGSDMLALKKSLVLDMKKEAILFLKPEGLEYVRSEHALYITEDPDDAPGTEIIKVSFKRSLHWQLLRILNLL